jgi:hypothetical protein
MILAGENFLNTEMLFATYISDCGSCLIHKPRHNYADQLPMLRGIQSTYIVVRMVTTGR